ncbi:iron-containing alcohol dehydrogenase family protein [Halorientalis regularis]|jgi:alcohol dehydrogenase class IV|uniref:Alcohol dehydrogenase, class IV n=1 Tax=Halorientalis regularis TaxID=660518 RepID=A0A1G7R692_9EURY|nr:iron-containing alcohol dehydrogenase family protein [Halorientalis regularis]SDG06215.1 Alcohol dehydrogenase, class IV [Halorientalis regularis]
MDTVQEFRFAYDHGPIRYGRGCVDALADELAGTGADRALVVSGKTVGSTADVIDPVEDGLGEYHAGTFAGTTPDKRLGSAVAGLEAMEDLDADALVSLGGGSSLDVAKAIAVLSGRAESPAELAAELESTGTIATPDDVPPIVTVPTTLAGADLSIAAGITATPASGLVEEPVGGGLFGHQLMPAALLYDPALFATTPTGILAGSAMNGFDKAIEALYASTRTAVTDATAKRALELLSAGLPDLREDTDEALEQVVPGIVLAQYGASRPDGMTLSLLHAFGHGLTAGYPVQQGVAHAVIAPHALDYLFEQVDGRRRLLADGLGVETEGASDDELADDVVSRVTEIRDALELPSSLREVDGIEQSDLHDIAAYTLDDSLIGYAPAELDPTVEELEGVLREAW